MMPTSYLCILKPQSLLFYIYLFYRIYWHLMSSDKSRLLNFIWGTQGIKWTWMLQSQQLFENVFRNNSKVEMSATNF